MLNFRYSVIALNTGVRGKVTNTWLCDKRTVQRYLECVAGQKFC